MGESPWIIRRAAAEDGTVMADMLVEAVNWSAEWKKKSRNRVLSTPSSAHYIAGWPRDTDLGVIAEANGEPIGAAWLRFLPATDPGYGFVAPDVPELTIGVAAHWRARGVGRALLRAVADREAFRFGWFHSGDSCVYDDEGLRVMLDRYKDIVKTGGENVSSLRVEAVLGLHPGVAKSAKMRIAASTARSESNVLHPGRHRNGVPGETGHHQAEQHRAAENQDVDDPVPRRAPGPGDIAVGEFRRQ